MVERLNLVLLTYKIPLALCLVGLVLIIGGIIAPNLSHPKPLPKESLVNKSDVALNQIKVNVSGAVNNPGVYSLNSNNRIEDAVRASGGFSEKANSTYISKVLNLSQKLSDGQKIYIPFQEESYTQTTTSVSNVQSGATSGLIGLNSGTQAQFESLPGIGPVTATKMIKARPFSEISELLNRKILSKKVYDQVQNLVDLN